MESIDTAHPSVRICRPPSIHDGPRIWQLAKDSGTLDLNSAYCYLMLSRYFSDTCLVAEQHDALVGFVTAFRPPATPERLFVWQIAVAETARGHGVGRALLTSLLQRDTCRGVTYLETTITPSNHPSQRLFASLARRLEAGCVEEGGFAQNLFVPEGPHQAEHLIRIGPFDRERLSREEHP